MKQNQEYLPIQEWTPNVWAKIWLKCNTCQKKCKAGQHLVC